MSSLPIVRFLSFDDFVTGLKHGGTVECRAEIIRTVTPDAELPGVATLDFTLIVTGVVSGSRILKFITPFAKSPGVKSEEEAEKAEADVLAKFATFKAEQVKAESLIFKPGIYE